MSVIKHITDNHLDEWGALDRAQGGRYSAERLAERWGDDWALTPLQWAEEGWIPVEDRVSLLLRPEILGERVGPVVGLIADRAVERCALRHPSTRKWAQRWLFRQDRGWEAAKKAVLAALKAAAAAEAAAKAAGAAVWAAVWTAPDAPAWTAAWAAKAAAHAVGGPLACSGERRWQLDLIVGALDA
jgi:hypothetical protein